MPFVVVIAFTVWVVMGYTDDGLNPTRMQNWLALGFIIVVAIFGWIAHSISRMADAAEKGAKK